MTDQPTTELEWLADQGIQPPRTGWRQQAGADNLTLCPQCSHTRKKSKDPCLNIRFDDRGVTAKCHHCDWRDGFIRPDQRSRGGEPRRPARATPERPEERKPAARPVNGGLHPQIVEWLAKRGISAETAAEFGIFATKIWFPQVQAERPAIAFPYRWGGRTVHHKYRSADKMFTQDRETWRPMFNIDSLEGNDEAVWVEGEMDVVALDEAGIPNGISLCDGATDPKTDDEDDPRWQIDPASKRFQPYVNSIERLAGVKKFILWPDEDRPGRWLKHQIAERVGRDRCWVAEVETGIKDANQLLQERGPDAVRRAIERARPMSHRLVLSSQPIGTIDDWRVAPGMRKYQIGLKPIDDRMAFRKGQLVLVTGMPGDGKSAFVDYLNVRMTLAAQDRGENWRTLMWSPEHDWQAHAGAIIEKKTGRLFRAFRREDIPMSSYLVREHEPWFWDHFAFVRQPETGAMTPDRLFEAWRAEWMRGGLDVVTIDPYSYLSIPVGKDENLTKAVQRWLVELVAFIKEHQLLCFLIVHPSKVGRTRDGTRPTIHPMDVSDSANFFNTCHIAMTVRRPNAGSTAAEIYVWKVKDGDLGTPGTIKLEWQRETGRYVAPPEEGPGDDGTPPPPPDPGPPEEDLAPRLGFME